MIIAARGSLNGVSTEALLPARGTNFTERIDIDSVRPSDVVVIREPDPFAAMSLIMCAWSRGAVPLVPHADLAEQAWWPSEEPGNFVLPGVVHEWEMPPQCAVVHTTSGSTGAAKLVMRSVESILWEADSYDACFRPYAESGQLAHFVTFAHSLGWGLTLSALLKGRDLRCAHPRNLGKLYSEWREWDVLAATPALIDLLLRTVPGNMTPPNAVFCGAGRLNAQTKTRLTKLWPECDLLAGFGSTETGGVFAGMEGLGQSNPGVQVLLPDERQATFRLRVRLPHDVLGYVGQNAHGQVWEFPDLVRQRSDGTLEHVARISEVGRRNDKHLHLEALADELAVLQRDWKLVQLSGLDNAGHNIDVLLIEGEPLDGSAATRIVALARDGLGQDITVETLGVFPRDTVGKVSYDALLQAARARMSDGFSPSSNHRKVPG
jgi:acyl-CoA synthetase (AMP-forming)/AMP-acid ligase II